MLADEWMGHAEMDVKPRRANQLSTNPCLIQRVFLYAVHSLGLAIISLTVVLM